MINYMHCQPLCTSDFPSCTSYVLLNPSYSTHLQQHSTDVFSSYAQSNQTSSILTPRRRRRLEDPIITYASNYYAAYPTDFSQSIPSTRTVTKSLVNEISPPTPSIQRIHEQTDRNILYCDLFNLLEHPESTSGSIKQRRRAFFNHGTSPRRHHHRLKEFESDHSKMKSLHDRKRSHQQNYYHKEKKRSDDNALSSHKQYERTAERNLKTNEIYQRRSPAKGFFRRMVRQYFCMPPIVNNNGYSS